MSFGCCTFVSCSRLAPLNMPSCECCSCTHPYPYQHHHFIFGQIFSSLPFCNYLPSKRTLNLQPPITYRHATMLASSTASMWGYTLNLVRTFSHIFYWGTKRNRRRKMPSDATNTPTHTILNCIFQTFGHPTFGTITNTLLLCCTLLFSYLLRHSNGFSYKLQCNNGLL